MNYVLSERTAAWLKRQMARAQGYKPAAQAPSRLIRRDVAASVSAKSLYPLMVRYVPSAGEGADVGEGDYIIYVPAGSVVVNGVSLRADDVPLTPYDAGAYAERPDWYILPQMADGDSVVIGISYDYEDEDNPLLVDIYTGEPLEGGPDDGTFEREIVVANVSVTQAGVRVFQVVEGPLIFNVGVETLNGEMGHLAVVGGKDGMVVSDGDKYWITVNKGKDPTNIEVSLTDVDPNGDGSGDGDGYCNGIIQEHWGGAGGGMGFDNGISKWPCNF